MILGEKLIADRSHKKTEAKENCELWNLKFNSEDTYRCCSLSLFFSVHLQVDYQLAQWEQLLRFSQRLVYRLFRVFFMQPRELSLQSSPLLNDST
jgi:hypothetical protein